MRIIIETDEPIETVTRTRKGDEAAETAPPAGSAGTGTDTDAGPPAEALLDTLGGAVGGDSDEPAPEGRADASDAGPAPDWLSDLLRRDEG